ncbi:hypothetical protein N8482_01950 [Chitinophagales bacterium]|nr:hypothetical protein [Chitinophagales bacterium]
MNRFLLLLLLFSVNELPVSLSGQSLQAQKVNGVNLMPCENASDPKTVLAPIENVANANWISLVYYQYGSYENGAFDTKLDYSPIDQKWGETDEGLRIMCRNAHEQGLQIMLKPSIWFPEYGWPGDWKGKENEWQKWEASLRKFILAAARLAAEEKVELLCFATELKSTIRERPEFIDQLITEIKEIYSGKLCYAANWDNYNSIPFWDRMDYIGVDAYFPLDKNNDPSVEELNKAWEKPIQQLKRFSKKMGKDILFTEYGYKSMNGATWKQWEIENLVGYYPANLDIQTNGYQAIFESLWQEDWMAGGFLWYWLCYHEVSGGPNDEHYSPQNKPAEEVISKYYGQK